MSTQCLSGRPVPRGKTLATDTTVCALIEFHKILCSVQSQKAKPVSLRGGLTTILCSEEINKEDMSPGGHGPSSFLLEMLFARRKLQKQLGP